jgi:acyl-CoA reductase-like NAD-dependent aldehyde dehydrogenase
LSSLALARLIHEAGCPPGVLNFVTCDSATTQRAVEDSRTRFVSFTGSDKVGWMLKDLVPEKRVVLELGGDASVVIMPDADREWAVEKTVSGAYGYAGQICISVQHILVHTDVYDETRRQLTEATRDCPTGDPSLPETVCGPLINSAAADRVSAWIEEAKTAGATVLTGGGRTGNVITPTLVENVPSGTHLGDDEVFGPVATLRRFETTDQAVEIVNSSRYGIQTGVFTNDASVADQFYRGLEVGGVIVNDGPNLRFDNMPYGGVKRSGFGREGVEYAFEEMTELKVKVVRSSPKH